MDQQDIPGTVEDHPNTTTSRHGVKVTVKLDKNFSGRPQGRGDQGPGDQGPGDQGRAPQGQAPTGAVPTPQSGTSNGA